MRAVVTEEDVARYRDDGVVLIRNLLDERWLSVLADGIADNLRRPSPRTREYVNDPASGAYFFYDALVLGEQPAYDRVMLDSPMAEAVAALMESSTAVLFYISVFVRGAGTAERSPWHQDQPSWSAAGDQACSAWVPLDPVPLETALEFVRGSHRWRTAFERAPFFIDRYERDDRSGQTPFPDIEANRAGYDILGWEMSPGDCLVFHGMTTHGGSGALPAGLGRRAVSVQWLGDDARFREVPGGDSPRISEALRGRIRPGDPVACDVCPVVWPRATPGDTPAAPGH